MIRPFMDDHYFLFIVREGCNMKEKLEEIRSKGLKKIEEVKKLEDLQEISREITIMKM